MLGGKLRLRLVLLPLICVLLPTTTHAGAMANTQVRHVQWASVTRPLFDFHSNFWVNLHQVLLNEARLRVRAGKPDRTLQSGPPLSTAGMSNQDSADWNAVVSVYAAHFGTRPQVFDDQLTQINNDLAAQPDNGAHLNPAGLPPEMVVALRSAAVIYRKYWWPTHDESNENWIALQKERVQNLGPKLAAAMTKDLHQQWPAAPIRVDVCYYVAALGHAFTTRRPDHITFSSTDPSNRDLSGFELLFHEASHTFADMLMNALSAEGSTKHKDAGDLWHAVLFYTSGVELRRLLSGSEQASFTPYADRYGVYRGRWRTYLPLMETDWQAYLDGKIDFTHAIHSMVAGLSSLQSEKLVGLPDRE